MVVSPSRAWLSASVLAPSTSAYVGYLRQHGYCARAIRAYLHAVGHFARWLTEQRNALDRIDEALVGRFLRRHLPICRCPSPCKRGVHEVRAALKHLLRVLRHEGRIPGPSVRIPPAIREELERFDAYLDEVCGLALSTRVSWLRWVRKFLHKRFGRRSPAIALLKPGDMLSFITRQAKRYEPGTARGLGCALRSYLRFRAFHGDRTEALIAAIPSVAQWPQSRLPRHLTTDELARFLDAFDQRTISGQRGYAMARCLVDLGLRASEVARIEFDDLNWREGTLRIRSTKSRRVDLLPLPAPTGQAIVQYLRNTRPQRPGRALFVRHRAPIDVPVGTAIVRNTVRLAFARCGLGGRYGGTHVLRHTAATRLLEAGANLKGIADILRHRCLDTSTIYAKVDLAKLAAMATRWPGSAA